jgi:hypothetical protein
MIAVVEAVTLFPGPYTNTNPPCGLFKIREGLRGRFHAETADLVWKARKTLEDYEEWSDDMPEEWRIRFISDLF